MKLSLIKFSSLFVCLFLLISNFSVADEQDKTLAEPLRMFSKFIGSWESTFAMMDGNPHVVDVAVWERALNGKAIRSLHSINDGMYGGEMLMFWDKELNSLVFYYFTTADFYTKGTIEVVNETSFIAYEDVSGSDDGITKVKSTSTLVNGNIKVTTAYLKNDEWTEPEVRTYTPSTKTVNFK
ncbi:hypothetical protein RGQ13_15495 [Thalassotalea psychrophila]|uniref:DUF1579 domain-containing protein n=1 Tax=Thalassotalea psychrophila TaxID=3065647 RepID=A0ABY9TS11_9GAMM|nr:hypothetical protein RGQ13_15495 [Colwelliaceae bacterium SQ149]